MSSSHSTLRIVLGGEIQHKNLVLSCIEPEFISGPTAWTDSDIVIRSAGLESGGTGIVVTDEKNGVRVVAEAFELKENLKLW